jgi:hypothetical protein
MAMRELPLGVTRVFVGLILSPPSEYSAYSVVGKVRQLSGPVWQILELDRFPSMSPKQSIAELVASTYQIPFISSRRPVVCLYSVVGVEEIKTRLKARGVPPYRVEVINLTSGVTVSENKPQFHSVPKVEASMTFSSLVEDGKVQVNISDPEIEQELKRQLEAFTLRLRRKRLEPDEEVEDVPEDLTLACCVPIWFGSARAIGGDKPRKPDIQEQPDPHEFMQGYRRHNR